MQTPAQQGGHENNINPKDMQIQLTGFLGAEQGMMFMKDLWVLLLSAQVPPRLSNAMCFVFRSRAISHHSFQSNCKLSRSEGSKVSALLISFLLISCLTHPPPPPSLFAAACHHPTRHPDSIY